MRVDGIDDVTELVELDAYYRARYAGLVRLARSIVGSTAAAEEAVQETFVKLQRAWHRVEDPDAYVYRAVVNTCRSMIERERRRSAAPVPEPVALPPEIDETWQALHRLPARYRVALALRFYEDRSEREIAELLDCRVGTVKSLIHRGLRKLEEELR